MLLLVKSVYVTVDRLGYLLGLVQAVTVARFRHPFRAHV